jgi:hypothetical protein
MSSSSQGGGGGFLEYNTQAAIIFTGENGFDPLKSLAVTNNHQYSVNRTNIKVPYEYRDNERCCSFDHVINNSISDN